MDHVLCTKQACKFGYDGVFQIEMLGTDGIKKCIAVVLGCEQGMVLSHIEASSVKRSVILMMDAISKIMIGKLSFPNPEGILFG